LIDRLYCSLYHIVLYNPRVQYVTGLSAPQTTASYSPAASTDSVETKSASVDDVKRDVTDDAVQFESGAKAACSGLDTLAAVADRLRQEMLDQEAAEYGEAHLNASNLDGVFEL